VREPESSRSDPTIQSDGHTNFALLVAVKDYKGGAEFLRCNNSDVGPEHGFVGEKKGSVYKGISLRWSSRGGEKDKNSAASDLWVPAGMG